MLEALLEAIKNKEPSEANRLIGEALKEKSLEVIQEARKSVLEELGFTPVVEEVEIVEEDDMDKDDDMDSDYSDDKEEKEDKDDDKDEDDD